MILVFNIVRTELNQISVLFIKYPFSLIFSNWIIFNFHYNLTKPNLAVALASCLYVRVSKFSKDYTNVILWRWFSNLIRQHREVTMTIWWIKLKSDWTMSWQYWVQVSLRLNLFYTLWVLQFQNCHLIRIVNSCDNVW